MPANALVPIVAQPWTTKTSARVQTLKQSGILASQLDGKPHQEIHVGDRELLAVKDLSYTAVFCEGSVAEIPLGRGFKSVPGMKRGFIASVDGEQVRVWRPRFGPTLRSRALCLEGDGVAWSIVPEGLRKYRVTDESGTDLLRRNGKEVVIERGLPSDKLSLLVLVHVTGLVLSSSMLWHLIQGL